MKLHKIKCEFFDVGFLKLLLKFAIYFRNAIIYIKHIKEKNKYNLYKKRALWKKSFISLSCS